MHSPGGSWSTADHIEPSALHACRRRLRPLRTGAGGLATGLRPWHEQPGGLWIGWPADLSAFTASQHHRIDRELQDRNIVPVLLSTDQIDRSYATG